MLERFAMWLGLAGGGPPPDRLAQLAHAVEHYIGLLIGAQAFQEVPKAHAVAVVFALIPNIASWAGGLMTNAVGAAGSTPEQVGDEGFANAGLVYHGTLVLGGGAILAGLILGAIVAFIIDKEFVPAAVYCFLGAALGFVGLIHAERVGWNVGDQVSLGYLFGGIVLLLFWLATRGRSDTGTPGAGSPSESATAPAAPADEAVPAPREAAGAGEPAKPATSAAT